MCKNFCSALFVAFWVFISILCFSFAPFVYGVHMSQAYAGQKMVYLGGFPIGITLNTKGVIVIGVSSVTTNNGEVTPFKNAEIKEGDVLTHINKSEVNSATNISSILNDITYKGDSVTCTFSRNGSTFSKIVTPAKDSITGLYKLGLWIRDNAAGVGTMTYIDAETYKFACLGHAISDIDTSIVMPVLNGNIYKCNIIGVQKGVKGKAGELKGLFLKNGSVLGNVTKNCEFGVYGQANKEVVETMNLTKVVLGNKSMVKVGKAQIYCTVDGTTPKAYDVEIIKAMNQNSPEKRSLVLKITDKTLLALTGGIVQGMSGSPIVQNNVLIGAVTHVFVNDPTKGFGLYADWMSF